MPRLRPAAVDLWGLGRMRTRVLPTRSTIGTVSSSESPSITVTLIRPGSKVWWRTDSRQAGMWLASFRTGMTTSTVATAGSSGPARRTGGADTCFSPEVDRISLYPTSGPALAEPAALLGSSPPGRPPPAARPAALAVEPGAETAHAPRLLRHHAPGCPARGRRGCPRRPIQGSARPGRFHGSQPPPGAPPDERRPVGLPTPWPPPPPC